MRILDFGLRSQATAAFSQERDRSKIPDQHKWDLTALYPSKAEWTTAKEKLVGQLPSLAAAQGKLASSAKVLADTLENQSELEKVLTRLYLYAMLNSDEDTRSSVEQGMKQEMIQIATQFGEAVSFFEPEILKADPAVITKFVADEPRLKDYKQILDDIVRRREHTGTDAEEKILAGASIMGAAPQSVYGVFSDADFPFPTVVLSDGTSVKLDKSAFAMHRASKNREDRQKVMVAYFEALGKYRATFGTLMNSKLQGSSFYSRSHKYPSGLAASLDGPNIPTSVYMRLIEGVGRNLPTFHRYLKLRKRMMGVGELHYYDLYAPLVASVDLKFSVEEAEANVLASLAPLGPEYAAGTKRCFTERWIDMYPNEGKSSGAYSAGDAYDVHPYILMNYNGKYDDMSTLTHELGHTMHSFFSNKTQPYPLASYPIFVAEVASTFNEALLIDYMLKTIKDDQTRLLLLGNFLEGIKGTVFRQTQFAEFELRIHETVEKGQPVTGDVLASLYDEIVKRYYGHDAGVCIVDSYVANEWSYIPHFYNDYYVFQYATSFTASSALSEKVLSGDAEATRKYLKFISSGRSKYPIELLKDAGVDMTTDEPLELTMKKMNRVMDEMERVLG
ncbi:MAG TPA: oligoendopeptidase F [Terriglobales bacterium]|jgi:oligoendopeptidase F|nr:oligoendopeptidase F [Terriglobales bacterium]